MGSENDKSWTMIFEDINTSDSGIRSLERRLVQSAAEVGFSLRCKTVASWLFRSRQAGEGSFQGAPTTMNGLPMIRRRGRGAGPHG